MKLSRTTQLAHALGIETKRYKQFLIEEQHAQTNLLRKQAFLNSSREEVLQAFPELQPVFDVQDSALRFCQDVLIATPTSLNTNHRNQKRAQSVALEALHYLEKQESIPAYTREGRHEEATLLKEQELRTVRRELTLSYEDNARVNPALSQESDARYAQFSTL